MVDYIASKLTGRGLDLVYPFQVGWYNREVQARYSLPDFGRPESLGILVGNTKALWPKFIGAFRRSKYLRDHPNPLDTYVQGQVRSALAELSQKWEIRWDFSPPEQRIAMQRLAEMAGCATLSVTHLSVHPQYGPWISLRAVIVLDVACRGLKPPKKAVSQCIDCELSCVPALERAMSSVAEPTAESVARGWEQWLAVRDACVVGGPGNRFCDNQLRYLYTKDRSFLRYVKQ